MVHFLVPDKPHFPTEEEKVLEYWNEIGAFQKQLELSEGKPEFTFYDGPPFATGLPHYGHIAAGTIKVSSQTQISALLLLDKILILFSLGCRHPLRHHEGTPR